MGAKLGLMSATQLPYLDARTARCYKRSAHPEIRITLSCTRPRLKNQPLGKTHKLELPTLQTLSQPLGPKSFRTTTNYSQCRRRAPANPNPYVEALALKIGAVQRSTHPSTIFNGRKRTVAAPHTSYPQTAPPQYRGRVREAVSSANSGGPHKLEFPTPQTVSQPLGP